MFTFSDAQLLIAYAAGAEAARQVWEENGNRKAPFQCPVFMKMCATIPPSSPISRASVTLAQAWTRGYQTTNAAFADAALSQTAD